MHFFLTSSRVTLALRTRARLCFTRRKAMSELRLVTSGLWCYSKCQSQECHLGWGMTLFTMCGAFLSKQCWVRSDCWSAVMDASPGAAETPTVSNRCQIFSDEESGAMPVLQVTLEGGRCMHRSRLQSLLKPIFS